MRAAITFVHKLQTHTNALSTYLWDQLPESTRQALQQTNIEAARISALLVPTMDRLLTGPSLYEPARFSEVKLSPETQKFLDSKPTSGGALSRLNRALLQDAYGSELGTTVGYRGLIQWSLWGGTACMVASGIFSFAMQWRSMLQAVQSLAKVFSRGNTQSADEEKNKIVFHTDAVQAGGYLDLDVNKLGVDLLSLGAHKFHGPKGVGALYVRTGTPLMPMQTGGGQERSRRAGTENIPYIVGMATALKIAQDDHERENARLIDLREKLVEGVLERIAGAEMTGDPRNRLPGHASFVIPRAIGDEMVLGLDLAGVAASTGSACTAGSAEPSHVLGAMGYAPEVARGALRLTLGRENTGAEVDYAVRAVAEVVGKLRR